MFACRALFACSVVSSLRFAFTPGLPDLVPFRLANDLGKVGCGPSIR